MATRTASVMDLDLDDDEADLGDLLPLPPGFIAQRQRELAARIAGRRRQSLSGPAVRGGAACGCDVPLAPPRVLNPPPRPIPVREPRSDERDWEVAVHEAGHAAAALCLPGVTLLSATVEPEFRMGECVFDGVVYCDGESEYQRAISAFSGPLAAKLYAGGSGDLEGVDLANFDNPKLSARTRAMAEENSRRIVNRHERGIREIARALQQERTIDGDRLRRLFVLNL